MLSTYEMEDTTQALGAGRPTLQIEALEERLAPCDSCCCCCFCPLPIAVSAAAGVAAGAALAL